MDKRQDMRPPGQVLDEMMKERGWTQTDLSNILGKPQRSISEIINGKKAVTPETAVALASAFDNSPEFWIQLEGNYRLSKASEPDGTIRNRARLYEIAPVKEMQKRGWISDSSDARQIENDLLHFFGMEQINAEPSIDVSRRSSITELNSSQRAWCFRAKQLAQALKVSPYSANAFERGIKQLKRIAASPSNAGKVQSALAKMGIRFVVVEPLSKTRIDGAAFWLDSKSPVIAMSIRFDRIDSFWHTLGHELSHIRHRDGESLDVDLVGENRPSPVEHDPVELRADREAAATWLNPDELESFILRVGPLYSKSRINQFANRIQVHPGIIVGQLQYRGELGYQACRETLVKIRNTVTAEALTDGWGHMITQEDGSNEVDQKDEV